MTELTSLSGELLNRVGELTDLDSLLDLACVSRHVANSLQDLLKRHQAAARNRVCSDEHPLTIPSVLRQVIADPVMASHVRTINIWCNRSEWSHWKAVRVDPPPGAVEDIFEADSEPSTWSFQPGEIDSYLDLLARYDTECAEGSDLRRRARDELTRGDDGLLKALLIILCPNLEKLNYARSSHIESTDERIAGNSSLSWLSHIIHLHLGEELSQWPPGLRSLRHLAIGVETGGVFDEDMPRLYHPQQTINWLSPPNLESIYVYGLGQLEPDDDTDYAASEPVPYSSTVRHVYLENVQSPSSSFWHFLMSSCQAQLASISVHGGVLENVDEKVHQAGELTRNLQSLSFYNHHGSEVRGDRCALFYPREELGGYSSVHDLRVCTVSLSDLFLEGLHAHGEGPEAIRRELVDYVMGVGHDPALPDAIEILVLTADISDICTALGDDGDPEPTLDAAAELFDDVLAALIESTCADKARREDGRESVEESGDEEGSSEGDDEAGSGEDEDNSDENSDMDTEDDDENSDDNDDIDGETGYDNDDTYIYPKLKAIYVEPWSLDELSRTEPRPSKLWLQKCIKAGIERGVDVRTRTNVNPPRHQALDFHMAPDRYDLHGDLTPPENEEFDPITGQWQDRGCGNCGDCEECFSLFPKAVWAQAHRAPPPLLPAAPSKARQEVWTKMIKDVAEVNLDTGVEETTACVGYHTQPREQYEKDRRCAGRDFFSAPDGESPPVWFPETARQKHRLQTLRTVSRVG